MIYLTSSTKPPPSLPPWLWLLLLWRPPISQRIADILDAGTKSFLGSSKLFSPIPLKDVYTSETARKEMKKEQESAKTLYGVIIPKVVYVSISSDVYIYITWEDRSVAQ